MDIFSKIDINIMIAIALSAVLLLANRSVDRTNRMNKSFLYVIKLSILMLVLEILTVILPLNDEKYLIYLHKVINSIGFSLSPVFLYLWLLFINKWFNVENKFSKISISLLIINFIVCIATYYTGWVFVVSSDNSYMRGNLFIIPVVISLYFIVNILLIMIRNFKLLDILERKVFFLVYLIPILSLVIQIAFPEVIVIWSWTGISLIIFYIYLREREFKYDTLTGVWNRMTFNVYMQNQINKKSHKNFSLVYADLNKLKNINDNYGHSEGDEALKIGAEILKNSFSPIGTVVRISGDEFIVLLNCNDLNVVRLYIEDSKKEFDEFNDKKIKPYSIEFSYGFDVYKDEYKDLKSFIMHIDSLMYVEKKNRESV